MDVLRGRGHLWNKRASLFLSFVFCGWWGAIAVRETNKQSSKLVDILCTFLPLDFLPWKI
jgi:hypothetical protein